MTLAPGIDATLVERLRRPLVRPGVISMEIPRRISGWLMLLRGRLPLLAEVTQRWASSPLRSEIDLPIVEALWIRPGDKGDPGVAAERVVEARVIEVHRERPEAAPANGSVEIERSRGFEIGKNETVNIEIKSRSEIERRRVSEIEKITTAQIERESLSEIERESLSEIDRRSIFEADRRGILEIERTRVASEADGTGASGVERTTIFEIDGIHAPSRVDRRLVEMITRDGDTMSEIDPGQHEREGEPLAAPPTRALVAALHPISAHRLGGDAASQRAIVRPRRAPRHDTPAAAEATRVVAARVAAERPLMGLPADLLSRAPLVERTFGEAPPAPPAPRVLERAAVENRPLATSDRRVAPPAPRDDDARDGRRGAPPVDIDALAEKVQRRLLRQIAVDRERRGSIR